jgi:hypothetical protein
MGLTNLGVAALASHPHFAYGVVYENVTQPPAAPGCFWGGGGRMGGEGERGAGGEKGPGRAV